MSLNSPQLPGLNVAMVVASFSTGGGLELYAHKVVEGLLSKGLKLTVLCQSKTSDLSHPNLTLAYFKAPAKKLSKGQRLRHYLDIISNKIEQLGPFDLVHSQHLPVRQAQVVNFHNQTTEQLNRVGLPWEKALNKLKQAVIPAYRLRHDFDRMLWQQSSCNIFSSATLAHDFALTYGRDGNSPPSVVAYPGASLALEEQFETERNGPLTFLFVGRGYRKKGLDVLLTACQKLLKQGYNFRLLIAGLRAKPVDRLALQLYGLAKHVSYLGWVENMAALYSRSSALVMPSRLEPFGMAALQAMQGGLVPIVSRVSGASEILHPGQNGLILEDHLNSTELARLMSSLLDNPELCQRLGRQARETAAAYTWQKTVESTLQAYQLALAGKPLTPACNQGVPK